MSSYSEEIEKIFHLFQEEITFEDRIRNQLSDLEKEFNREISSIRSDYNGLRSIEPVNLQEFYHLGSESKLINFKHETNQIELKGKHRGAIDDIKLLTTVFHQYMDTLECIDGKDIMKERFRRKICQDIYYILMLNRYFKVVAYTFHNKANELKLEIPFVTTTDDRPIGLILTPNEIEQLLALESINYNDYLLGLLRLIELMADYTSETIIQVSISPSVSNETKSRQYSVSLLNLQSITKLQSGFQMLDLKNDTIRRKYDGLKYNLKKVSGIVYDLSLRNLIKNDVELY